MSQYSLRSTVTNSTGNMSTNEDDVFEVQAEQAITPKMLLEEIKKLQIAMENSKNEIIQRLQKENLVLKKSVSNLKNELEDQNDLMHEMERDIVELQQYVRRNNIEIVGIPESVQQEDLEEKVIELASELSITLTKNDIEACHRLAKKPRDNDKNSSQPRRTIVRFVNRKHSESFLKRKKNLKNLNLSRINLNRHRIFINNNLCNYNRMIWGCAKRLFDKNLISRFWTYNGIITIKVSDDDVPNKIGHISDLEELFPEEDFSTH